MHVPDLAHLPFFDACDMSLSLLHIWFSPKKISQYYSILNFLFVLLVAVLKSYVLVVGRWSLLAARSFLLSSYLPLSAYDLIDVGLGILMNVYRRLYTACRQVVLKCGSM